MNPDKDGIATYFRIGDLPIYQDIRGTLSGPESGFHLISNM